MARATTSADADTLARLEGEGRVAFRYCDAAGTLTEDANRNGSLNSIAGIYSEQRNVLGMMPTPRTSWTTSSAAPTGVACSTASRRNARTGTQQKGSPLAEGGAFFMASLAMTRRDQSALATPSGPTLISFEPFGCATEISYSTALPSRSTSAS